MKPDPINSELKMFMIIVNLNLTLVDHAGKCNVGRVTILVTVNVTVSLTLH